MQVYVYVTVFYRTVSHLGEFSWMLLCKKNKRPDLQKPTKYNFIETIRSFTIKAVIMLRVLEQSWRNDADNNINNINKQLGHKFGNESSAAVVPEWASRYELAQC